MSDMPSGLLGAVQALAASHTGLRASAGRISEHYRQRGASRAVIGGEAEAVAYALSRMPATYAAVSYVLAELSDRAPDFVPRTLLDVGAGPGTAAWAASEIHPGLGVTLLDHNRSFLDLSAQLGRAAGVEDIRGIEGDMVGAGWPTGRFELVTCAYALTEMADAAALSVAERMWAATDGALAIIEPGRPREHDRLMSIRTRLIELGAEVVAPCPHMDGCPLIAPDWCHFAVRLSRTREHRHLKGGTLGYEDEKFSYLVVTRPGLGRRVPARVIRPVTENKFEVGLALCTAAGAAATKISSRDRGAFKMARKVRWGDGFAPSMAE